MHMNILITGGAGYIGTSLTKRLLDEGLGVTVFDNLNTGQRELVDKRAQFVLGDVLDCVGLEKVCVSNHFDSVIHLAALKSVREGEQNPSEFVEKNVIGTLNVLETMKKNRIRSLIFSSSAAVYQENDIGIYDENCPLSAKSIYGSTKIICEELITQYERLGYFNQTIIFRYFNIAGDSGIKFFDKHAQNLFPVLARANLENKPFSIFGNDYNTPDGTAIRDYIHLSDLTEAHVLCLKNKSSGVFNLGTERGTSVKEIVNKFNKHCPQPLVIEEIERKIGDAEKAVANSTKAKLQFGWAAQFSLEDMINSTIETYNAK